MAKHIILACVLGLVKSVYGAAQTVICPAWIKQNVVIQRHSIK